MSDAQPSHGPVLKSLPRTLYYTQLRLMAWHPQGVLNEAGLKDAVDFMESEEQSSRVPFNRFINLDDVTELRLRFGDTLDASERRRASYSGAPVKTAIVCSRPVGFGLARMYATLMEGSRIEAQVFRERAPAAEWLGVPLEALCPPDFYFEMHAPTVGAGSNSLVMPS